MPPASSGQEWQPATRRRPPPPTALTALTPLPAATNCYQWGEGGWDLIWWGDPNVRLPPGGAIPTCSPAGTVIFHWREPQGVFLLPGPQCPGDGAGGIRHVPPPEHANSRFTLPATSLLTARRSVCLPTTAVCLGGCRQLRPPVQCHVPPSGQRQRQLGHRRLCLVAAADPGALLAHLADAGSL